MERIKQMFGNLSPYLKQVENPYVMGIIIVVIIVYLSLIAHKLPHAVTPWIEHPIFKIGLVLGLMLIHKFNPSIAILVAIVFVVIMSLLMLVPSKDMHDDAMPLGEGEMAQMTQETREEITREEAEVPTDPEHQHRHQPQNQLVSEPIHPFNRPTSETDLMEHKVIDPNDPAQPGNEIYADPNLTPAIYDLNPPYAEKVLPSGQTITAKNYPHRLPTRYSAFNGYVN